MRAWLKGVKGKIVAAPPKTNSEREQSKRIDSDFRPVVAEVHGIATELLNNEAGVVVGGSRPTVAGVDTDRIGDKPPVVKANRKVINNGLDNIYYPSISLVP